MDAGTYQVTVVTDAVDEMDGNFPPEGGDTAGEQPVLVPVQEDQTKTRLVQRKPATVLPSEKPESFQPQSKRRSVQTLTGEMYFMCDSCHIAFTDERDFHSHNAEVHGMGTKRRQDRQGKLHCPTCNVVFTTSGELLAHLKEFNSHRRFKCQHCDWHCSTKKDLRRHERKHSDVKPYSCDKCGQGYSDERNLKEHEFNEHGMHRAGQEVQCDFCHRMMFNKTVLNKHLKTHHWKELVKQGKQFKLFHCEVCQKEFITKQKQMEHMVVHTRNRPYKCPVCGKGFTVQCSVKRHVKERHSGLPRQQSKKRLALMQQQANEVGNLMKSSQLLRSGKQAVTLRFEDAQTAEAFQLSRVLDDFAIQNESDAEEPFESDAPERVNLTSAELKLPGKRLQLKIPLATQQQQQQPETLQQQPAAVPLSSKKVRYLCGVCNDAFDDQEVAREHVLTHTKQQDAPQPTAEPPPKLQPKPEPAVGAGVSLDAATLAIAKNASNLTVNTGEKTPTQQTVMTKSLEQIIQDALPGVSLLGQSVALTLGNTSTVLAFSTTPSSTEAPDEIEVSPEMSAEADPKEAETSTAVEAAAALEAETLPSEAQLLDDHVSSEPQVMIATEDQSFATAEPPQVLTVPEGHAIATADGQTNAAEAAQAVTEAENPPEPQPLNPSDPIETCYQCGLCFQMYVRKEDAEAHLISHTQSTEPVAPLETEPRLHLCTGCGGAFTDAEALVKHLTEEHKELAAMDTEACSVCGKLFKDTTSMKRHMLTHSGERPFACTLCDKTFTRKLNLQNHIACHTNEKPYKCDQCGMSYAIKYNFQRHVALHDNPKPFACDMCDKRYSQKQDMEFHKRKFHLGEQPKLKCGFCDRTFYRRDQLDRHEKYKHHGILDHECELCGKTFESKYRLERHVVVTHGDEKPCKCTQCDKAFKSQHSLKSHLKTHEASKPFECTLCGKAFREKKALRRHVDNHP